MVVKRVHVIACGVLAMDLRATAERLGLDVSFTFLPGGLHNSPLDLRHRLQAAIDEASAQQRGDLIAVGYGVCGLGTVGICARHIPLAIPRVNDCIALFLGSDAAYKQQFAHYPGTYYVTAGWVEEKAQPDFMPDEKTAQRDTTRIDCDRLVEKLGRENAEMIRWFLSSWQRNYQRAAFIDTGVSAKRHHYAHIAQEMAKEFGWKYEELDSTGEILANLLKTRQTTDEILIVPPHHATAYDPVNKGLKAVPIWESESVSAERHHTLVFDDAKAPASVGQPARLGLGIDAGGTYTDLVIYEFQANRVVQKAKALTTKWNLAIGIEDGLDQLDPERLSEVDLVAISTTLATNSIVEGKGQKVGLLIRCDKWRAR